MPYLRPSKKINDSTGAPKDPNFVRKDVFAIDESIKECPIAQYIINEQRVKDFVKRGNKTILGRHIETCEICKGTARPESSLPQVKFVKEIDYAKDELITKLTKENKLLKEQYETLKAIKANSASPILFPHQTKKTVETMQSKKIKYLEELLKKDELAIANLKEQIVQLKALITLQEKGSK